jgi:hypothetical protein
MQTIPLLDREQIVASGIAGQQDAASGDENLAAE